MKLVGRKEDDGVFSVYAVSSDGREAAVADFWVTPYVEKFDLSRGDALQLQEQMAWHLLRDYGRYFTNPGQIVAKDAADGWRPIESAPWQEVVWVRNNLMENPVKATRGYAAESGVCADTSLFTTVLTRTKFDVFPPGDLCCPTQWKPLSEVDE